MTNAPVIKQSKDCAVILCHSMSFNVVKNGAKKPMAKGQKKSGESLNSPLSTFNSCLFLLKEKNSNITLAKFYLLATSQYFAVTERR